MSKSGNVFCLHSIGGKVLPNDSRAGTLTLIRSDAMPKEA